MIYLDIETTGLDPHCDEVVEIALVDQEGNVLLNTYVRPARQIEWNEAQEIHGISPKMVANAPTLTELKETILNIVKDKHVRIYNASFDESFINLSSATKVSCVMLDYAKFKGVWDAYYEDYKWHKLSSAARTLNIEWMGKAHSACSDADMTRRIDAAMNEYVSEGDYRTGGNVWSTERKIMRDVIRVWATHDLVESTKHYRSETELLGMLGMREIKQATTRDAEEVYAKLFFNKSLAEIQHEDLCEKLKAKFGEHYYTKNTDIPSSFISKSVVKKLCVDSYVFDLLDFPIRAVVATVKTTRNLYAECEIKEIIANSKEAQLYLNPNGYTLTELRKMGFKDTEIQTQEPTGIKKTAFGNIYYTYPMPSGKKTKKRLC